MRWIESFPDALSDEFIVRGGNGSLELRLNYSNNYKIFEVRDGGAFTFVLGEGAKVICDTLFLRDGKELILKNNSGMENFEVKSFHMGAQSKITVISPGRGQFTFEQNEKGELKFSEKLEENAVSFQDESLPKLIKASFSSKHYIDSDNNDVTETFENSGIMTFNNEKQYKLSKLSLKKDVMVTIDGTGEVEIAELNLEEYSIFNIKNPNVKFAGKNLINQEANSVISLSLPNKSFCSFTKETNSDLTYTQDYDVEYDICFTSDLKQAIIKQKGVGVIDVSIPSHAKRQPEQEEKVVSTTKEINDFMPAISDNSKDEESNLGGNLLDNNDKEDS